MKRQLSLVKCPDCGAAISPRALQCPRCGCPQSEYVNNPHVDPTVEANVGATSTSNSVSIGKNMLVWILLALLILGVALFVVLFVSGDKGDDADNALANNNDTELPLGAMDEERVSVQDVRGKGRYEIGDYYNHNGNEGIVFWTTDGGYHGKIVSMHNAYTTVDWWDAKDLCLNYKPGWYLPTQEELLTISLSIDAIERGLSCCDGDSFSSYGYWSSTDEDDGYAWFVYVYNGYTDPFIKSENSLYYVRAVTQF